MFDSDRLTSFPHGLVQAAPLQIPFPAQPGDRDVESRTARLVACSGDDLGRLAQILRGLEGHAVVRGVDGAEVPVVVVGCESRCTPVEGAEATLSEAVYDENGDILAFLEIVADKGARADASNWLLASLVNSVARSISERWFRIRYRRQWIVAALRLRESADSITFAVDRENRIVGADRWGRDLLESRGLRLDSHLSLAALFQGCTAPLRLRRFSDAAMSLLGTEDGVSWSVLITPPDHSADPSGQSERVMVHARPRLGALTRVVGLPPATQHESGSGLPPRMLRRVNEYIDAHLDADLNITELAGGLGISESHFARCFRRSTGLTPHAYVMRRRLLYAQKLVAETNRALVDIALATGFADQSHFSRRFSQLTGLPPRAFRAMYR